MGELKRELFNAASEGDAGRLRAALATGADPNSVDGSGRTALFRPARLGFVECVQVLLQAGCDAKVQDEHRRATALMGATLANKADCVAALLPRSDPNVVDGEGCTALIIAAQHQCLDCAKLLVPVSDLAKTDYEGRTAAQYARGAGDHVMAELIEGWARAAEEAAEIASAAKAPAVGHSRPPL